MKTKNELKIAAVVGTLMLIICLVMVLLNTSSQETIDIKVYKVNEEDKIYEQCPITTDTLIQINSEFKSAYRLSDSSRVIGKSITGKYKVISGNNYIAFDAKENENYIYRGDTKYLYEYDSNLYNIVEKACQ